MTHFLYKALIILATLLLFLQAGTAAADTLKIVPDSATETSVTVDITMRSTVTSTGQRWKAKVHWDTKTLPDAISRETPRSSGDLIARGTISNFGEGKYTVGGLQSGTTYYIGLYTGFNEDDLSLADEGAVAASVSIRTAGDPPRRETSSGGGGSVNTGEDETSGGGGSVNTDPGGGSVIVTDTTAEEEGTDGDYRLLAPLFGLKVIKAGTSVGEYLNMMIKFIIAVTAALAVIMLVMAGLQYMSTDNFSEKSHLKSRMVGAIGGLLLALASYAILYTVNPNLVNTTLRTEKVSVSVEIKEGLGFISGADYEKLTGRKLLPPSEYLEIANKEADKLGLDHCIVETIFAYESGGNAGAIGHDENAAITGVGSRRRFVDGGVKYSGETFEISPANLLNGKLKNDDAENGDISRPDLGLDWRFSHGLGLFQVTPMGKTGWKKGDPAPLYPHVSRKEPYTVQEVLSDEVNIRIGMWIINNAKNVCNGDINGMWRVYAAGPGKNGSGCYSKNPHAVDQAEKRTATYNECVEKRGE